MKVYKALKFKFETGKKKYFQSFFDFNIKLKETSYKDEWQDLKTYVNKNAIITIHSSFTTITIPYPKFVKEAQESLT
jgi:hypothetical protein